MNAYTSPDLLVWSATLASCAVPILFPPVRLTSKRYDVASHALYGGDSLGGWQRAQ